VRHKITLLTKMAGVAVLCLSLTGCPFFCIWSAVLTLTLSNASSNHAAVDPLTVLGDCLAQADNHTCPSSGFWDIAQITPCIPGTIDPTQPPLLVPEALESSAAAEDVQASHTVLPRFPTPLQRVLTPGPPARIDCTDPANAGRGQCAGTNRQNKPLFPPGG
jgi:hypothetical protein